MAAKTVFFYEVFQQAVESFNTKNDIITEIRFWHHIKDEVTGESLAKRLYVAHVLYDDKKPHFLAKDANYDNYKRYIEMCLGESQIAHMENLLLEDIQEVPTRQYVNVGE